MVAKSSPTRKSFIAHLQKIWPLYILLLPSLLYILIFCYYPMYGAQIAFKHYTISDGIIGSEWVGWRYFEKFINSHQFRQMLINTLRISIYGLVATSIVRLVLSLALNSMRTELYKKVIQTVTYMPHFISTVVLVGIVIRFFNPSLGAISKLIQALGGTNRDLMGVSTAVPHIYIWSGIWQNAGWSTILFIATLSSVDPELHEAAIVDGASRMHRIIYIDLPTLIPIIVICLIMDCGRIMSVGAEKMLLMQNDLNLSTTQIISTYVYKQGIASNMPQYSYATAINLFNNIINFLLIITVNSISKKLNQSSLW